MAEDAPAAMALARSPEYRMPPSAITGAPEPSRGPHGFGDGGELRHADAGDNPRGADRTRPDANLHRVGAGVDQGPGAVIGGDIAGDDLDPVGLPRQAPDGIGDLNRMAMGGVDHHHVDAGVHQGHGALETRVAHRRGCADQQAALGVLGGAGMSLGLLHVLDGDQADGAIGLVDHDQALDLVPAQKRAGLVLADAFGHRDQALRGHQRRGRRRPALSKRMSRLVRMPTSLPVSFSTTGKPLMRRRCLIWRISARVVSGWMVRGLITMPLS